MRKNCGLGGEDRAIAWMKSRGVKKIQKMRYLCPYDAIVNGKRVEIITSRPQSGERGLLWKFNIHRHGTVQRNFTDFFLLRLEKIPGREKQAIHLLVPSAEISTKVIGVSFLSLARGKWAGYLDNLSALSTATL